MSGVRHVAVAQVEEALRDDHGVRLWRGAPLAPFTTFGSGGRADLLVTVDTVSSLVGVLDVLDRLAVPWAFLGAGSNVLVDDRGFSGVVLKLGDGFSWVEFPAHGGEVIGVGASLTMPRLAAVAADKGLAGLEFLSGIPGSVGGGIAMNAGAHGRSLSELAVTVEVAGPRGSLWVAAGDLEWGYRGCGLPPGAVVTAARLHVKPSDPSAVIGDTRTMQRQRRTSQPRGMRSFGSVFKNPPGGAAGTLLEQAGMKGVRRGGAEVSRVHANFIVNADDASTTDVLGLMASMRRAVLDRTGVTLEPEVRLVGGRFPWDTKET